MNIHLGIKENRNVTLSYSKTLPVDGDELYFPKLIGPFKFHFCMFEIT